MLISAIGSGNFKYVKKLTSVKQLTSSMGVHELNIAVTLRTVHLKSQVGLLQTAHYRANAGVLLGGRMH